MGEGTALLVAADRPRLDRPGGDQVPARRSRRPAAIGAALFAAAVVLPLLRQSGQHPWDTMWAEDGQVFLQQSSSAPPWELLFRGYAGYAQTTARLLIAPVHLLPVDWAARYVAVAGSLASALLALFVYRMSGSSIRRTPVRLALAAVCVLHPVLLHEITATIVNVLWLQLFAAFWAIVTTRDRRDDVAARGLVVFLAITTSPLTLAYLPVLAWTAGRRRHRGDRLVAASFLAGMVVQAVTVMRTDDVQRVAPSTIGDLAVQYPVRVLGSVLVGDRPLPSLWEHLGVAAAVVLAAVAVALLVPALRWVDAEGRAVALAALILSVVLFCAPVWVRGTAAMRLYGGEYNSVGSRYVVVPALLLLSAAAVLCDRLAWRWHWLPVAFVAWSAVILVVGFRGDVPGRSGGPSWAAGVADGRAACRAPDPDTPVIPLSPGGVGWGVNIDCDTLLGKD